MNLSLSGRIRNLHLPSSQALLPLYEAIVNAIHGIEDAERNDGRIQIHIHRDTQGLLYEEQDHRQKRLIAGFTIVDNGIGFTEENYVSFDTSDSQRKRSRGGRGIGRFTWLKAFRSVEVESVYEEAGKRQRRCFSFTVAEGISNLSVVSTEATPQTTVNLRDMDEVYQKRLPGSGRTIATRIMEHCLEYFVLGEMPTVVLEDDDEAEAICINDLYREAVASTRQDVFHVDQHEFQLTHFLLHAQTGMQHQLCYCANQRVVRAEKLGNKIADLSSRLPSAKEDEKALIYAGYVSGVYLDEHVDQQRTGFQGMNDASFQFEGEVSWGELESAAVSTSSRFLVPFTSPVRDEKHEYIRQYVNGHAPQFRPLVKHHPEKLDTIPPHVSEDRLNLYLYEAQRDITVEMRRRAHDLVEREKDARFNQGDLATIREEYNRFLEEWNELGKAELAQYIIHRKITLTVLENRLALQNDGRFALEDAIHGIIFPLRTTSDDVDYEQQNLWIIDERLAYHNYLASDIPLRHNTVVNTDSLKRPDIFIDTPTAYTEDPSPPYSSGIVIVEFKRPMRDDYNEDSNPVGQVVEYVEKIREGKARTPNGREIRIGEFTPFYCYVICDLTRTMRAQAKRAGMQETPDRLGYFWYNMNFNAYIEIIDYQKLLVDAKRRNDVLFKKLNLPES